MTKARNIADLLDANGKVDNDDIANIDASKIVSGDISAARLSLATETKPVVSSVSPSVITNDAQDIVITGTDFTAIPRVDIINTATGIWYSASTVTHDSATQLTVNLTLSVDAGTYRIRVENPDGLAGLSGANFLTVSDAPTWSTSAGSLGSKAGGLNGAVATVSAGGDTITYAETTNVLTNASLANCSLNSSTGAITTSDFDGSSTSARTHTFTIRATDAQGQTSDREFTLTSSYFIGTAYYLVVAGGGSGGSGTVGGGGGAGGYRTNFGGSAYTLGTGTTYTVTVGNGGGSVNGTSSQGNDGANSIFSGSNITDIISTGGGGGGLNQQNGRNGGSGGGSGATASPSTFGQGNTPSTSPSQGNNGGTGFDGASVVTIAGGGGGAGAVGGNSGTSATGSGSFGGPGGNGSASSITGSSVTYAGGGGGVTEREDSSSGAGGTGGGGAAANRTPNTSSVAGTANLGGGGGGGGNFIDSGASGAGGSGVVILRMLTSDYNTKTGITGTYSASAVGSDTAITWTASGNITF